MTTLLYFLPLSLVISLVLSATKKDEMSDVFLHGGKLFAFLTGGTLAFSAALFFCAKVPLLLYALLGSILLLLAFFTVKGLIDWMRAGKGQA